jgi:hypothetical protein
MSFCKLWFMSKKATFFLLSLILIVNNLLGQDTSAHRRLYTDAYQEINQMLEGTKPESFKRAVFLMENAYLNGTLSYEKYNDQIISIAISLKQMVKDRHLGQYKTSGNWAVFTYMVDAIPQNNQKPYHYDFDNYIPDKDRTVGFVSKLLKTGKGNCVSLPYLYKILANEIGASSNLALAPMHCYIKHKNEQGKWINLELTNGSFSRDEWIMQQCGITVEQIESGIYMHPLTSKESLALVLENLADNYQLQFGVNDNLDLQMLNTGLKYYANGVYLYNIKFEHYRKLLLAARKRSDKITEMSCNKELRPLDEKINELGYKPPSKDDYKEWVEATEKGKKDFETKNI